MTHPEMFSFDQAQKTAKKSDTQTEIVKWEIPPKNKLILLGASKVVLKGVVWVAVCHANLDFVCVRSDLA